VFATPLRLAAIVTCLFVLAGFLLFAIDEARGASKQSQLGIAGVQAVQTTDPSPDQEKIRERIHSKPREFIDDVNDVLLSPFSGIVSDHANKWARRAVPALLALFVYGFGLGFLSRYAQGRSR
jgi:hypothetical protein